MQVLVEVLEVSQGAVESSEYGRKLTFLDRVISPEPVLSPEVAELARVVADRYAGSLIDVLRMAIPPRHARVEAKPSGEPAPVPQAPPDGGWARYPFGPNLLDALRSGRAARAVWQALPAEDWPARLAEAEDGHVQAVEKRGAPDGPGQLTAEATKQHFLQRAGMQSWEQFLLQGEAREQMMASFKESLTSLAQLFTVHEDGPYLEGKDANYADIIVGGWLNMFFECMPADEWKDFRTWHGGVFARLHDALQENCYKCQ